MLVMLRAGGCGACRASALDAAHNPAASTKAKNSLTIDHAPASVLPGGTVSQRASMTYEDLVRRVNRSLHLIFILTSLCNASAR